MAKLILNYIVCTFAIGVAIALVLGGGWWSLCGFVWCGALYISGVVFPAFWRRFWRTNMRILRQFDCL